MFSIVNVIILNAKGNMIMKAAGIVSNRTRSVGLSSPLIKLKMQNPEITQIVTMAISLHVAIRLARMILIIKKEAILSGRPNWAHCIRIAAVRLVKAIPMTWG